MPKLLCTSPISVAISVSLGEVTTTLRRRKDLNTGKVQNIGRGGGQGGA